MEMTFASHDVLEPQDLALLRLVLEEVCADKGLAIDQPESQALALDLVNWFLFGVRNASELKAIIEPIELAARAIFHTPSAAAS
jgi:hypothetical protein